MPDEEWAAGHAKARENGETLTDVLRRLLSGYLIDNSHGLSGYQIEYRAIPKINELSDAQRAELTVEGLVGRYEDVRRLYPPGRWHLEERTVSPYRSATPKSV